MKKLIIANPGTGKTTNIAKKYKELVEAGVKQENILCLTFTRKAREEMEDRIIKFKKDVNIAKLNVQTFHSFALSEIEGDILDSNKMRYLLFKYLLENKVFTYSKDYIISEWVPRLENAIRYIKSFGVLPDDIKEKEIIEKTLKKIGDNGRYSKEDVKFLIRHFIRAYKYYENNKNNLDYNDLLIKCLKNIKRKFEWVLVDELQDVNNLEADIALKSGNNIFAVGDAKQAIFGFQGGSIQNFSKFKGDVKTLSTNYRSTNNILRYAKQLYINNTKNEQHKEELKNFMSEKEDGEKVRIAEYVDAGEAVVYILNKNRGYIKDKKIGILVRNNSQIPDIKNALINAGYEFNVSYENYPEEIKSEIIEFIKGLLSEDKEHVRRALITPFSPVTIQKALKFNKKGEIPKEFVELKNRIKKWQDLIKFYDTFILKTALIYGEEYFKTAVNIKNSLLQAKSLGLCTLEEIIDFLKISDYSGENEEEKNINVMTVHKAKGKDFDMVIYLPRRVRYRLSLVDYIVESILESLDINIKEEVEEEELRIDFVALTRAKEKEYILLEEGGNWDKFLIPDLYVKEKIKENGINEYRKRVISGILGKLNIEEEDNGEWIKKEIRRFFKENKMISFSSLKNGPEDWIYEIFDIPVDYSEFADRGTKVHKIAKKANSIEDIKTDDEEIKPYIENLRKFFEIEKPKILEKELSVKVKLNDIFPEFEEDLVVAGKIDVVYEKDGKIWIGDYKTGRGGNDENQQLYLYKKMYAKYKGINEDKIRTVVIYLGKNNGLNTGYELEIKEVKSGRRGLTNKIRRYLAYKNDPDLLIEQLKEKELEAFMKEIVECYICKGQGSNLRSH